MTVAQIKLKLYEAQKGRDALRVSVLGYLLAAINNAEIAFRTQGKMLGAADVESIIEKQIEQRVDSIQSYKAGNRQDLVDNEAAEMRILKELLDDAQ